MDEGCCFQQWNCSPMKFIKSDSSHYWRYCDRQWHITELHASNWLTNYILVAGLFHRPTTRQGWQQSQEHSSSLELPLHLNSASLHCFVSRISKLQKILEDRQSHRNFTKGSYLAPLKAVDVTPDHDLWPSQQTSVKVANFLDKRWYVLVL